MEYIIIKDIKKSNIRNWDWFGTSVPIPILINTNGDFWY